MAVRILVKAADSKVEEEAAARLHLGEVAGKEVAVVLVMEVLAVVPPDMEKDLLMMEEERGRPFLLLVPRHTPSVSRVRSILYGSASGCTSEKRACHL